MNDCPSGAGAPALHRVVSFRLCFMYPWFHRFSDAATEGGRRPSPTWARLTTLLLQQLLTWYPPTTAGLTAGSGDTLVWCSVV